MSSPVPGPTQAGYLPVWRADLRIGLSCCLISNAVVLGAVWYAGKHLPRGDGDLPGRRTFLETMLGFDGPEYKHIAGFGYHYRPHQMSNVVFFPLYPLLALDVALLTNISIDLALVVVSKVCFAAALVLLSIYTRRRWPEASERLRWCVVLMCALFPAGCFFHMAYTEACFLMLSLAAFTAFDRRLPVGVTAAIVGLATAARPTGVALLAPLAIHLWRGGPTLRRRLLALAAWLPIGCWGLIAYMTYQYIAFGNPLAFALAQESWRTRPLVPFGEKAAALATLEPLRAVYDPASPACWRRFDRRWPLSWQFANPIYFVLAWALIALGAWRRWLSAGEVWFSALLLLIPYVTRGYEMGMGSMGRFVSAAFPIYCVLGHQLAGAPRWLAAIVFLAFACYMAIFSARFAAGHFVF